MNNLKQLPDLAQLKEWGSFDDHSYQELKSSLENCNRILVLAPANAGKNTVQHAIVNHLHRLHKEPFVIPSVEEVPLKGFSSDAKIKNLRKLIKDFSCFVAAIQFEGDSKSDIDELTKYLLGDFDLVVDLRNLDGKRVVCKIIKCTRKVDCVYQNPLFNEFIAA